MSTEREVILKDGSRVPYDSLIVATGSTHSYFGHPEWAKLAPGLKTVEDATEIRTRILLAFERAEKETDPAERRANLTFVVVGGGPTGVELAGALGEISRDTLRKDFRHINPADANIFLIEGEDRVLPHLSAAAFAGGRTVSDRARRADAHEHARDRNRRTRGHHEIPGR